MQKYSSNVTTSSGSAIRGAQVYVFAEDGSIASVFSDRLGQLPLANPVITASDGTYSFYAANGRYSLQCTVEGVKYVASDVVLLDDPADVTPGAYAYPLATQAEAEDSANVLPRSFTPQRIWQAIAKWWTGITVPVTQGGTGAVNAQGARTALGVDYGTTAGSVAAGNDQRINDGETAFTWGNHAQAGYATHAEVAPKLENITGLVLPGTNIAISGSGTSAAPYVIDSGGASGALWGAIGGTLSSQSDLSAALAAKADSASLGTAATKDESYYDRVLARYSSEGINGDLPYRLKLKIPMTTASVGMMRFQIDVYSDYTAETYLCSGYLYPTDNNWFSPNVLYSAGGFGAQNAGEILFGREDDGTFYVSIIINRYCGAVARMQVQAYVNGAANALVEGWQFVEDSTTPNSIVPALAVAWNSNNLDPASFATAAQGAKADSALQSETDPTVPAWAKTPSKPSYTKAEVGLGNVDNTSDLDKPISTAQLTLNPQAFSKADPYSVAFLKTAANAVSIKAGTYVMVAGAMVSFTAQTPVVMPALTAGTDYAIYACSDGTLRADASFTAPAGYTTANSRQIGGFHYAPGSNAAARAGGDTTPQINPYSFWDLKFRPACADPRGMVLVAGNFWADIYLTGVDHIVNGSSKYNVTTAVGTRPPKVPLEFGGDGTLAYGTLTWWEAAEVARSHGKQLPTYDQFGALAFGTTEQAASGGTDVPTTGQTGTGATTAWNALTSKWGVIQSTGCLWTWGREFAAAPGAAGPYNWFAETSGRGSIYEFGAQSIVAALFGASRSDGSNAGSRASLWSDAPSVSGSAVGLRCVVPHQVLV